MEGFAAPDRSAGATNALSFLTKNPESLVPALLDAITKTQLSSAIFVVNLVIAVLVVYFFMATALKRAIDTGNTGRPDGDGGLAWWAFRFLFGALLVVPLPDYSLGQRAVVGAALAGSGFADRIAIAAGPARDAMRASLVSLTGTSGNQQNTALAIAAASPEGAATVAKLFEIRWCQLHLSQALGGNSNVLIAAPTPRRGLDGTQFWDFATEKLDPRVSPDACGSVSLPLSAEDKAEAGAIARAFRNYSDVSQTILIGHQNAILTAANDAATVIAAFPIHTRDAHLQDESVTAWRSRVRAEAQRIAAEYDRTVIAAGGGVSRAAEQPRQAAANEMDARWGWINYGLNYHRRASVATDTINALSWQPRISGPRVNENVVPKFRQMADFVSQDMRAAGLVPPIPTADSSGSFDLASYIGVDKLRAALQIFSNPSADVFEVAGLAGPILTNIATAALAAYAAASYFVPGLGSFVSIVFGTLLAVGQTLQLALPLAPLVAWMFLVVGWLAQVLLFFVALPFCAIALARDDEPGFWSPSVTPLIGRFVNVLLLPTLLVIGISLLTPLLQLGWTILALAIRPIAQASTGGSVLGAAFSVMFAALFVVSTLVSLVYFAVSRIGSVANLATEMLSFLHRSSGSVTTGERIFGGENTSSAPVGGGGKSAAPQPGAGAGQGAGGGIEKAGAGITNPKNHVAASVPGPKK